MEVEVEVKRGSLYRAKEWMKQRTRQELVPGLVFLPSLAAYTEWVTTREGFKHSSQRAWGFQVKATTQGVVHNNNNSLLNYKRKRSRKPIRSSFSLSLLMPCILFSTFSCQEVRLLSLFLAQLLLWPSYHFKMIMLMMMAVAEGERSKMLLLFVKSSLPPPPPDVLM